MTTEGKRTFKLGEPSQSNPGNDSYRLGDLKSKGGRPTKLTKEIITLSQEYIDNSKDEYEVKGDNKPFIVWDVKLPTIEGLANYLNVNRDSLYEWEKESEEYSDILTRVRNAQAERLINKGLAGQYNPVIAKLLLTKHGYSDKSEVDTTLHGDVQFINDVPRGDKGIDNLPK